MLSCSSAYEKLQNADKFTLFILKETLERGTYRSGLKFQDIPVFLTHTSLDEDLNSIGRVPVRYLLFYFPEMAGLTITCLSEPDTDMNQVYNALGEWVAQFTEIEKSLESHFQKSLPAEVIKTPDYCVLWTFKQTDLGIFREYISKENQQENQSLFTTLTWQLPMIGSKDEERPKPQSNLLA